MKTNLNKIERNNQTENKLSICAIICELNPMHTGHLYLIEQAKKLTNCDYLIGLMSGNFSQRSEACILDKYTRAKIATQNGFDLMIGLPTAFCTNNAEVFALSSIKILNELNVTHLAFGVETKNVKTFFSLASFMLNEPKEFKKILKQNLKNGLAYFNAYTISIETYFNNLSNLKTIKKLEKITNSNNLIKFNNLKNKNPEKLNNLNNSSNCLFLENFSTDFLSILSKPNNILALEYIKALIKTKSKIKPIFIERVDNYNNDEIKQNFASASFLRKQIIENNFEKIKHFLPKSSHNFFKNNLQIYNKIFSQNFSKNNNKSYEMQNETSTNFSDLKQFSNEKENQKENSNFEKKFIIPDALKTLILYKLKSTNLNNLKKIYAISEGFENKLKTESFNTFCFDDFYKKIQTKRFKQNKINSALLNTLLEIDKKTIEKLYTIKNNIFVKILAINPQKREILGKINAKMLISRKKDVNMLKLNSFNKKLFEIENNANIVYNLCFKTQLIENDLFNKMK